LLPNPELRASVGTRGRESVEDWQLALLIAVVVLADIPVLFWLLRHRGRHLAKAREDYQRWRARLDSDPRLKRLYEAHRRTRWERVPEKPVSWRETGVPKNRVAIFGVVWRAGFAHVVDVLATMAAAVAVWSVAWSLVTGRGVLGRFQTGISEVELVALAVGWGAFYLTLQLWVFPRAGTTLGLRLLGLVVVSPWDGRRAARLAPDPEMDYRTDRVPGVLVVPREEFEAAWGGFPPP
jgi:hypothetical protein